MPKTKPRLNLDIFSDESKDIEPDPVITSIEPDRIEAQTKSPAPFANKKSPRFVPVGFYPEHLRLLDDAVIKLRRQGHWQASKSGIIRRLIEKHKDHLEEVWLKTM